MLDEINTKAESSIKLIDNAQTLYKKIVNWNNFKKLISLVIIASNSYYFVGTSFIGLIDINNLSDAENMRVLIKIIFIGISYYFTSGLIKFLLRLLFHSHIQTKIIEGKKNMSKRDKVEITNDFSKPIYIIFVKTGYLNSILNEEFDETDKFNAKEKEEFIDEQLIEIYSWITLSILSLITITVVYGYYKFYIILLISFFLMVQLFHGIGVLFLITHIDLVERFRIKLKREKNREYGER